MKGMKQMSQEKIKVLNVIGALNMGGAETMAVNILRNIDKDRFQVDFYLSGNSQGFYEKEVLSLGSHIYNVGHRKKHPLKYCSELKKLIKKGQYDVVQIHATDAQDGLPAFVAKSAGVKKVCLFSHSTAGLSKRKQALLRKLFMSSVTHKQACSELAGKWMFGERKKTEFSVIPLPINCSLCKYDEEYRNNERKKYSLENTIVIGHIGRYVYPKNHEKLINIFAELAKRNDDYRLILIGGGINQKKIDDQIELLGLADKVIQLGQIPNASKEISMFDMMVMPSRYEGFPTVLLEGQANGVVCIGSSSITKDIAVTDLVSFVDLTESETVWADVIENRMAKRENPEKYNMLIAEEYDIKAVTKLFEQIYES